MGPFSWTRQAYSSLRLLTHLVPSFWNFPSHHEYLYQYPTSHSLPSLWFQHNLSGPPGLPAPWPHGLSVFLYNILQFCRGFLVLFYFVLHRGCVFSYVPAFPVRVCVCMWSASPTKWVSHSKAGPLPYPPGFKSCLLHILRTWHWAPVSFSIKGNNHSTSSWVCVKIKWILRQRLGAE